MNMLLIHDASYERLSNNNKDEGLILRIMHKTVILGISDQHHMARCNSNSAPCMPWISIVTNKETVISKQARDVFYMHR